MKDLQGLLSIFNRLQAIPIIFEMINFAPGEWRIGARKLRCLLGAFLPRPQLHILACK